MFFPTKTEKIEIQIPVSDVVKKISFDIEESGVDDERKHWFKGAATEKGFEISLILKRPNNFVPVISGMAESDEKGTTMVLIQYQLLPATKRFLVFWTVITLLLTMFFAIPYDAYLYAAITFSTCLVNYIITRENFNIQVRKSRRALKKVLGVDN